MKQIIGPIVVAGHVCLDLIPSLSHRGGIESYLVPGKLIEIGVALTASGGAVSNTGLALHRLGLPVKLMGKVGNDLFGQAILDIFAKYDRSLISDMIVDENDHSSYSIVLSAPQSDRIFLHFTGANDTFSSTDIHDDALQNASLFHFGYPPLMNRMYLDQGQDMAALFSRAKGFDLITSLDMAMPDPSTEAGNVNWRVWLQNVLPYVDFFLPSYEEILYMLDREMYESLEKQFGADRLLQSANEQILSQLAHELLAMGAGVVVIKLGEYGLYAKTTAHAEKTTKNKRWKLEDWLDQEVIAPCFTAEVVGTTGAGDCTIAGFLAGVAHGQSLAEALISAVAVGAHNVEQADAISGIPSWDDVQRRIAAGWERKLTANKWSDFQWNAASGLYIKK